MDFTDQLAPDQLGLVCRQTGVRLPLRYPEGRSPAGGVLDVEDCAVSVPSSLAPPFGVPHGPGLWRYRSALPLDSATLPITLGEGLTPMLPYDDEAFLKVEGHGPTGSFKDRGSSVLVTRLQELGIGRIEVCAQEAAALSMAAYCARAGIELRLHVPTRVTAHALRRIRSFGATVLRHAGSSGRIEAEARLLAGETYFLSCAWHPWFLEGIKTLAFEILEQLGRAPDRMLVPVSNGTLLLGLAKGFRELWASGLVHAAPQMIGVQPTTNAPLVATWNREARGVRAETKGAAGEDTSAADKTTGAAGDKPRLEQPVRAGQILQAVQETGGRLIAVADEAWRPHQGRLRTEGLAVRASAATVLGAWHTLDATEREGCNVLLLSGR